MRKMTHGASGSLICHGADEGQGLSGGRANVVHPTPLEAADGGALVGGHELPVTPDKVAQICYCLFFLEECWTEASRDALLVKRQLQGDLYECVRTHPQFLDIVLPIIFEDKDLHVQVVHQPVVQRGGGTSKLVS